MRRKKRSFTLIEIVLCIALLSLIGGLLTYKGKDLISKSQANAELSKLKKTLDLMQTLALSYHADIDVSLSLDDKHTLFVQISSDEEVLKDILKPYQNLIFTHIKSLGFIDNNENVHDSKIVLKFYSTGWSYPNKTLLINNKKFFNLN